MIRPILIALALVGALPARAGILDRCVRALSRPDPYEFETAPVAWVTGAYERAGIRAAWGRPAPDDAADLNRLGNELRRRLAWPTVYPLTVDERTRVDAALGLYGRFER